ncbi:MAG: hypothetical protein QF733_06420 [Phycisphaerales bacterium]|jgi:hypothetical protein|nr:hypothetical protein [Phycisphaerales bacterium]
MNETKRDGLIGVCAIAAVVSVVVLLQLFGEFDTTNRWTLTVLTPATAGIGDSSTVQLDGVTIGGIERVEPIATGPWSVRIIASIDEDVSVPVGVTPLTVMSLLTGSANLYLESPPDRTGETLPKDGTAELSGRIHSTAMRDITAVLDEQVGPALGAITDLGTRWAPVGDGLAAMLGEGEEPAEITVPSIVARADRTLAAAQSWLEDPQLRKNAGEVMHMALASLDRAVTALETFDDMASTIDRETTEVAGEVASAGRALAEALHQAAGIMASMQSGEGTAGQLLTNPDLYNRLEQTAAQLDRLAESMRLMVEQIREEGVGPLLAP